MTAPTRVVESRAQLINVFEKLSDVLRQAGLRTGLERFTEFANILFLKLSSEFDTEDQIWNNLLNKQEDELPDYLNEFVVDQMEQRYKAKVLSKTRMSGRAIKQIVQELNPLRLHGVDEDIKGVAFEHFLSRTTAASNDLAEYFTPRRVVRFMVQLLNPRFGNTVYDPFCGTGGFLIEAFRHLGQQAPLSADATRILHHESLFGRELTTTARVAKMNMILFGCGHSGISQQDSLRPQAQTKSYDCVSYDCVLSNIPFSLDLDRDRLRFVDPTAKDADEACLLHCFNSIKQGGKAAIIVPEGLVVNRKHQALWDRVFAESRVRVVATLPRGTFAPYTEAGTNILYLTDKRERRTEWYYRANACPDGVEVMRPRDGRGRSWNIVPGGNMASLGEIASITNGKMITKDKATPGDFWVIAGGRMPAYTHNKANTKGQCFTVSKSGAYAGYVWWHEYPVWASDCLVVRSNDEDEYMTFYLYLCAKAKQEEIYSRQQGTGQPHIYRKHIEDLPVLKLALSEQRDYVNDAWKSMRQRADATRQEKRAVKQALKKIDDAWKAA